MEAKHQAIRDEILNDPRAQGYAALDGDPFALHAKLNAPSISVIRPVPRADFAGWAAMAGVRVKIERGAASNNLDDVTRSHCLSVIDFVRGASVSLDIQKYANGLTALVSGGIITQADRDSLTSLATKQISWAENANLSIAPLDVTIALKG